MRSARRRAACPRAAARSRAAPRPRRRRSCGRSRGPSRTRTAAAPRPPPRGERIARPTSSRHAAMRSPTRGHSMPSSQPRSLGIGEHDSATARAVDGAAGGHVVAEALDHGVAHLVRPRSSSCTTASVDRVAAPSRSSAASASDLPAPIPPVSPTNGGRGSVGAASASSSAAGSASAARSLGGGLFLRLGLGGRLGLVARRWPRPPARRGLGLGLGRDLGRRLGRAHRRHDRLGRDLGAREDVVGEAELRHVVEIACRLADGQPAPVARSAAPGPRRA